MFVSRLRSLLDWCCTFNARIACGLGHMNRLTGLPARHLYQLKLQFAAAALQVCSKTAPYPAEAA